MAGARGKSVGVGGSGGVEAAVRAGREGPPDRDSPRQYLVAGLSFVGLVVAGILIGAFDAANKEPAVAGASPPAIETPVGAAAGAATAVAR